MPTDTPAGWAWFEPAAAAPSDDAPAPIKEAFVRAFASDAGRQVLAHLRAQTTERTLPPDASDAQLRHLEGQRALTALIQRLANPSI